MKINTNKDNSKKNPSKKSDSITGVICSHLEMKYSSIGKKFLKFKVEDEINGKNYTCLCFDEKLLASDLELSEDDNVTIYGDIKDSIFNGKNYQTIFAKEIYHFGEEPNKDNLIDDKIIF